MSKLLEAALEYAEAGIPVFPLRPKDKTPLIPLKSGGRGYKDATTNPQKIRQWWGDVPNANIGIPMGKISGLFGIDGDYDDGLNKDRSFEKRLPPTVKTITPTGNFHAYFKYPEGGIQNNLSLEQGAIIRSDGYYFVAPPSIHPETLTEYIFEGKPLGVGEVLESPSWILEINSSAKIEKKPFKLPETIPDGTGRERNIYKLACSLWEKGFNPPEILDACILANKRCIPPLEIEKVHAKVDWVCKNYKKGTPEPDIEELNKAMGHEDPKQAAETIKIQVDQAPQILPKSEIGNKSSPYRVAQKFLEENNLILRYHNHDFYRYKGTHYQRLDDEWVDDRLNRWLIKAGLESWAGVSNKTTPILKILKTKPQYIGDSVPTPCRMVNDDWVPERHMVPLANGAFNVKKYANTGEIELIPHSENFFCTYQLPYEFKPGAKCPIFDSICEDILQGPEEVLAFHEMMGIHIYMPFLLEKFFVLCGEGGNGKSVMRGIFECLLGRENISSVPIECFNPGNFAFASTIGKLANIIPDMKDVTNIDEGTLKAYVSQEEMMFNRKHKPHIHAAPSAVLTICTNVLPRFNDKSDGIWRRMVIFKFDKTIPIEKQNPAFRSRDFWQDNGELPGIFNRALEGLVRVIKRGSIAQTTNMKAEVEGYKYDLNYVAQFANECLEYGSEREATRCVYEAYKTMVLQSGGKPLSARMFARQLEAEAKKLNKKIDVTKKNERVDNYSGKFWTGIKLNDHGRYFSTAASGSSGDAIFN